MPTSRPILYAQQMSSLDNGLALWDPHPGWAQNSDGKLKPRPHVRPGDVGYVEDDGTFTRLFNLHLAQDHDDQGIGPFPDFQPEPLNADNVHWRTAAPTVYRSHEHMKHLGAVKTVAPAPVGGNASISYELTTGAVLGFFDSGFCEDSSMHDFYKKQFAICYSSWLQKAQTQDSTRCLENMVLVTGCTRVRSWVTDVIENETKDGNFTLSVGFTLENSFGLQLSSSIHFENSGSSTIHHGPVERLKLYDHPGTPRSESQGNRHSASPMSSSDESMIDHAIKGWSDQCIFIRGYRMKERVSIGSIPKKLKAAAGSWDFKARELDDEDFMIIEGHNGCEEDSEQQYREKRDHMQTALDYILENADTNLALIHEDDLLEYAKSLQVTQQEVQVPHVTVDEVLKACHPEVKIVDYGGIKVGVLNQKMPGAWPETLSVLLSSESRPLFKLDHDIYHQQHHESQNSLRSSFASMESPSSNDGYFFPQAQDSVRQGQGSHFQHTCNPDITKDQLGSVVDHDSHCRGSPTSVPSFPDSPTSSAITPDSERSLGDDSNLALPSSPGAAHFFMQAQDFHIQDSHFIHIEGDSVITMNQPGSAGDYSRDKLFPGNPRSSPTLNPESQYSPSNQSSESASSAGHFFTGARNFNIQGGRFTYIGGDSVTMN